MHENFRLGTYQNYLVRSAENACAAELAAFRTPIALARAQGIDDPDYTGSACVNTDFTTEDGVLKGFGTRDGTTPVGGEQEVQLYTGDTGNILQ